MSRHAAVSSESMFGYPTESLEATGPSTCSSVRESIILRSRCFWLTLLAGMVQMYSPVVGYMLTAVFQARCWPCVTPQGDKQRGRNNPSDSGHESRGLFTHSVTPTRPRLGSFP